MKALVSVIAAATALAVGACHQTPESSAEIGLALQAAMDESLPNSGAIGASAAVIFPDGTVWAGTSGRSSDGVPLTADMLFDIASTAKNLQATLALKLAEEGVIGLDDPIEKWLSPIKNVDGKISIRQLLHLTSGIHDFVGDADSPFRVGYVNIDFQKMWTWNEIQEAFIDEPSFEPGTQCEYSSTNYILLRQIIETAAHSKQSALLDSMILKPYRLGHTVADFTGPFPPGMRVAHGWFDTNDDGAPEDISGNSLNWIVSLSPMLVYSTPGDMAAWMDALYHKKTVLKEETLKEMLDFFGPVKNEPLMKGYGLGTVDFNLGEFVPQWERVRVYGHAGNQYGYMSFVGYFPDYGVSLAIMSNRGCDRDASRAIANVGGAVIDALLTSLGAKPLQKRDKLAELGKALERSPNDVHLMYRIAKAQQEKREDYEASLMYEEILKRDPDDKYGYKTEALFWKATYDGLIWKKPEGLIAFIADNPDYKGIKDAYAWLAKTYLRMDDNTDKAVLVYRDALRVFDGDADFYNHYAWWVYENKVASEYDTAIVYAKTATELKPDAYYIWDTLARLCYERGDRQRALEASTKALSLAPENDRGDMEKALAKIKKGKS